MSHITSRKHAAARQPHRHASTAFAMAALALPVALHAQSASGTNGTTAAASPAATAASAPAKPATEATLPTVKVQAAPEVDYKTDKASSPKFTQPLVDTPQTITVIKKELLQQQAATSLSEALRNTPGVTMQLGENGSTQTGDSINLRGFDTSASIFVDGVRDLGAISRDLFNIEQVEVVKGPSGSDNGRGASSGYINLVSKAPELERFDDATITVGTASRKRVTTDLNQPLDLAVPGSALRLNLMAQDEGVPGRDEVKAKRWGVAPTLAFGIGTPTRATIGFVHVQQDNRPDGGVSTFGLPGYAYGTGATALKPGPAVDSHNFYGLASDADDVKLDMFTTRLEHDIAPGSTLRNTTRIGRTVETVVVTGVNAVATPTNDPAGDLVTRSRQGRHQANEILTNQTNLSTEFDTAGLKHSLSIGVELIYEYQRTATPVSVSGATIATGAANLYAPDDHDAMAMPQYMGTYTRGSTLTAAAYAFDTIKLSDMWLLNGGVRWDKFHTETNSATYTAASATTAAALVQNPQANLTDSVTSWKVGAVFKPTANGSVYVEASDSKQPPAGTNFALSSTTTNQANASTAPQQGSNLELGTKWDLLDGRLAATGAIYRAENKNELISDGQTPATYSQVGKRRVQGAEFSLVGQATENLAVSLGLSTLSSKILRGTPTQQGGVLVFTPKLTFTSWATYKLPLGITVGGGVRYIDTAARSSNTAAPTTNLLTSPSYWVADAMASYDVTRNLSLQLNLYNLFDKAYMQSLNNGGSRYVPGAERNALLTAALKF